MNQFTQVREDVPFTVPQWSAGGVTPLTGDRSFEHHIPIIDDITKQTGETVTLFQRINPQGDMLRVATSVAAADGQRAIGTYIPRDRCRTARRMRW